MSYDKPNRKLTARIERQIERRQIYNAITKEVGRQSTRWDYLEDPAVEDEMYELMSEQDNEDTISYAKWCDFQFAQLFPLLSGESE